MHKRHKERLQYAIRGGVESCASYGVYQVHPIQSKIVAGKILKFKTQPDGIFAVQEYEDFTISWNIKDFGKTVFPTRDKAEQLLRKIEV